VSAEELTREEIAAIDEALRAIIRRKGGITRRDLWDVPLLAEYLELPPERRPRGLEAGKYN
jgi:hypothetical protein